MNMLLRRALLTLCYLFVSSFGVIYTDSSAFAMTAEQNSVITCPDDVPDSSAQLTDALAVCNYKQELWQGQETSFIDGKYADNTNQSQAAGVTTPNNLPSTAWWTVAYQVVINNNWEIETSRANQNSQKRLTENAFNDLNPSFNFGATKLAFESDRDGNAEIYTMNSDGTNQARITANNAQDRIPEWSPMADKILFVSRRDGNDEIYLMQSDGTNQSRLTVNASPDTFPVWSPNGNEIAWVQTNGNYGVIWLMNADGSNQRAISPSLLYLSHVTWSPDGGRIAFDYDSDQDGLNRIATIRTDGSELQDVDATPGYPTTLNDHWAGNWTPDGGSILYTDVQLMISGNQVIIASTIIRSICIDTQKCYSFDTTYNLFSLAPDIENSDPFPPVSSVRQFGPYTRAQQFAVEWKGTDVGPAGIGSYDLQYRSEQDLSWRSWLTDTYLTRDTPPNVTTGKWYFQSRAKDTIGNLETWPTGLQGDTSTTLYAWNIVGKISDARGNPINFEELSVEPSAVDSPTQVVNGQYWVRLPESAKYLFNGSVNVDAMADQNQDIYQLPANNLIRNGNFEKMQGEAFAGWISTSATQTLSALPYAGKQSLHLGNQCLFPCLESDTARLNTHLFSPFAIISDKEGNSHVFTLAYMEGLNYQRRTVDGVWDSKTLLFDSAHYDTVSHVSSAFDSAGRLHIVVMTDNSPLSQRLYYTRKTTSGIFLTPLELGYGSSPIIAFDASDNLHILYLGYFSGGLPSLYYRVLSPDGKLSIAQKIADLNMVWGYDLWVEPSGTAHIYWSKSGSPEFHGDMISHTIFTPDGSQSTTKIYQGDNRISQISVHEDSNSQEHLFWLEGNLYYWASGAVNNWTAPYAMYQSPTDTFGYLTPQVFEKDDILYWYLSSIYDLRGRLRFMGSDDTWSQPQNVDSRGYYPLIAMGERKGSPFIGLSPVEGNIFFEVSHISQKGELFSANQTITLPQTIHQPTLSFMYNLEGDTSDRSFFEVSVSTGLTETSIFSTTERAAWRQGWADMSAWKGQTITLTFSAHQAISDTYIQVDVDEITLGAWTTPQPKQAIPAKIDSGIQTTILISGENFLATPTVSIGNYTLTDVQWLNEKEIQATLPANIPPGIYNITVVNPDGTRNSAQSILAIGKQVYLPIISR